MMNRENLRRKAEKYIALDNLSTGGGAIGFGAGVIYTICFENGRKMHGIDRLSFLSACYIVGTGIGLISQTLFVKIL